MLEEWRSGRDSVGRTHEAHWKTLLEGTKVRCSCQRIPSCLSQCLRFVFTFLVSVDTLQQFQQHLNARWRMTGRLRGCCMLLQYAERLPIGLKEIVETVPASTVHAFYRRWYRPENMAVIIAGDFDPAAVKQLADAAMSTCHWPSVASPTPIPEYALGSLLCPNDPLQSFFSPLASSRFYPDESTDAGSL